MAGLLGRFKNANRRFNSLLGGIVPTNDAGGLLSPNDAQAAQQQAQLSLATSLLGASGPSPVPISFGQALGAGFQNAMGMQNQAINASLDQQMFPLQKQLLEAQIAAQNAAASAAPKPELGTLTLEKDGARRTLRRNDPQVDALLGEGWNEVRTPATQINLNNNDMDKPLTPTDLTHLRRPDGSQFPVGTTMRQAQEAGAMSYSEASLTRQAQVEKALNTLNELETLALDPEKGIFVGEGGSMLTNNAIARLASGTVKALGDFIGTDESQRRQIYSDSRVGAIGQLVRAMGEAGALAEGDVKRVIALLPEIGATPDTEAVARSKFEQIRNIISGGIQKLGGAPNAENDPLGLRK